MRSERSVNHRHLPSGISLDNIVLMLNKSFTAKLERSPSRGGWTYVVWPGSAKFFGTKGLVKITGKIDGHPFSASFMAMGDGHHMLPIKAETRKAIGKDIGETVEVLLEERR
jgi:hypothetical protein